MPNLALQLTVTLAFLPFAFRVGCMCNVRARTAKRAGT